jgi:hypothetical protein
MQEAYRQALPLIKKQETQVKSVAANNQLYNQSLSESDPQKKKAAEATIRIRDFTDAVKSKVDTQ